MTDAVLAALQIVREFAASNGWSLHTREPFFHGVEIHQTREALWHRILELNGQPLDVPVPTDALTAALEGGLLVAVVPEEARRARPEYFASAFDWVRALAHEIIHRLHVRVLGGREEAMGPPWFFEGFAMLGSGQPIGQEIEVTSTARALELAHSQGRGAYARYAAAIRYFAERIPLRELVAQAGAPEFEDWLQSATEAR
jgi:hypothetical protein